MTVQSYVDSVIKEIRCNKSRKAEIKKQLMVDIEMRMEQGEKLEDVVKSIGSAKEVAQEFNDNLTDEEKKRYGRGKTIKIIILITAIILLLGFILYRMIPISRDIAKSKVFDPKKVEEVIYKEIDLFDAADYDAMRDGATNQMKELLDEKTITDIKKVVSGDWGQKTGIGQLYLVELTQGGRHYAVGEVTVTYENCVVTYRLSFDEDMELAGFYVR